jgi:hypothetical protein
LVEVELLADGLGDGVRAGGGGGLSEPDGSGVGVGVVVTPPVPLGLVVGLVDEVTVGDGVPLAVAVGDGWTSLAPVAGKRGTRRRLLATRTCLAPSDTRAWNSWPAAVLTGRTKTARCPPLGPSSSGSDAMTVQAAPVHSVSCTRSPTRLPERPYTTR